MKSFDTAKRYGTKKKGGLPKETTPLIFIEASKLNSSLLLLQNRPLDACRPGKAPVLSFQ